MGRSNCSAGPFNPHNYSIDRNCWPIQILEGEWLTAHSETSVVGSFHLQGISALSTPHPVITQPKDKSCKALTVALFVRQ